MARALHLHSGFGPKEFSIIVNWSHVSHENFTSGPILFSALDEPSLLPASSFGLITATVVGLYLVSQHSKLTNVPKYQHLFKCCFVFLMLTILAPLFAALACYRCMVNCILKLTPSINFVKLMDGPDAVWNLSDTSRPHINILAEVESSEGATTLLNDICIAVERILNICPKLSWIRKTSALGFSYWQTRSESFPVEKHVRWLPLDTLNEGEPMSKATLQDLVSDLASEPLPDNDSSCWEILVGRHHLLDSQTKHNSQVFPILIRIHHSVGDGISLLELLLNHLSSKCSGASKMVNNKNNQEKEDELKLVTRNIEYEKVNKQNIYNERKSVEGREKANELTDTKMKFRNVSSLLKKLCNAVHTIVCFLQTLYGLVCTIISMNSLKGNVTVLDTQQITGQKFLAFYRDTEDESLISLIKTIKSQRRGLRFTDVFLTALSATLENYFEANSETVPPIVSTVIPVYMKHLFSTNDVSRNLCNLKTCKSMNGEPVGENGVDLKNCFSLGILKLPVKLGDKISPLIRLQRVSESMTLLHTSGQYLLNVCVLRWVASLLPENLLKAFLNSAKHNTMVVSNLIGPKSAVLFAGHPLQNLVFWIPNRGNTGVGISILSYNNRMQMGIIVDRALAASIDKLDGFLSRIVLELQHINNEIESVNTHQHI